MAIRLSSPNSSLQARKQNNVMSVRQLNSCVLGSHEFDTAVVYKKKVIYIFLGTSLARRPRHRIVTGQIKSTF